MAADYVPVAKKQPRVSDDMYSQALYLTAGQLGWMQAMATKGDKSLSWIAQRAVQLAGAKLGALVAAYRAPEGEKQMLTFYFPVCILDLLDALAAALDFSISTFIQAAITAAKTEVEKG